nr:hypothetical protein GCM10020093_102550 [Planobispora longispora]
MAGRGRDRGDHPRPAHPRTLLGLCVGSALGLAGALMQGLTRNPLADPGLLGVNAGASLAVVLSILLFGVTDLRGWVWFSSPARPPPRPRSTRSARRGAARRTPPGWCSPARRSAPPCWRSSRRCSP